MDKSARAASSSGLDRKPFVVAVVGGSGSGKTTFAERLCSQLGSRAVMISHDDYYKDMPCGLTPEQKAAYDFDCPDALDTGILVENLSDLLAGRVVEAPLYDFTTHARAAATRHIEPADVLVVEGILIMCDPALRELFDLVIFMDADPDVRVLRRVERDCRERDASLARAIQLYLDIAKPAHERYVEPYKKQADIVVYDAMNDRALELVVARLNAR